MTVSSAEHTRRDFLYIATAAVAAIGGAATLVPLIGQMNPDASTIAAGAAVDIDLAPIAEGQIVKVFWRSEPIFIFHRTPKEIAEAKNVDVAGLPDPETFDGWFCPCHGSQYDTAGRIRKGPAPKNLYLPPYAFLSASKIRIG